MEAGGKLKELNMTADEIDSLTKALRDEKFKEMLLDYAQELSDPENKKRYEEEIRLLEQERGNTIEFIHPEPFRALRTSVNGKQKCFINVCTSERVGKPECKWGVSEDGRRGQCWSLPHSLHPGRQDTDPKGNRIVIYDVIFHPDTLHIASKNKRFMDMVDSTAIQGIQDAFKVTLDKNNVREMSTKYKGTPQPCVTRKPIPGYKATEPSEKPDPLAFPYPGEERPTAPPTAKPRESPAAKESSDAEPQSSQSRPQKTKEPTKPNYAIKYRSFIDLQDFRCSRDSAQSPRPKEIVITIDVPLLKGVTDASLEVKDRSLLLESKKPAYRLELPLAYPVDEDKGEAKFHKQRGQLTVTLPVLPSDEAFGFAAGPAQTGVSDSEEEEEEEGRECHENEEEKVKEERDSEEENLKQQPRARKGEEEDERGQGGAEEQIREEEKSEEEEGIGVEEEAKCKKQKRKGQKCVEEKLEEQKQENEREDGKLNLEKRQQREDKSTHEHNKLMEDGCDREAEYKDSGLTSFQCATFDRSTDVSAEEGNSCVASPETENQPVLITAEEEEVNLNSCLESTPKTKNAGIKEEAEKTREGGHGSEKVETDAAFLHQRSSEESQTTAAGFSIAAHTQSQNTITGCCISQKTEGSSERPATDEANKSSRGASGKRASLCSTDSVKPEERESRDEDDLPEEQIFRNPEHNNRPPLVLLREIDKDGNEKVISDHSTSAGFIFQNSLMYELD